MIAYFGIKVVFTETTPIETKLNRGALKHGRLPVHFFPSKFRSNPALHEHL